MPDALFAAKELDVVLSNQLSMAHQLAMGFKFLRAFCRFCDGDALIAAQLARITSFIVALASKPSTRCAAVPRVVECDQAPTAKSLPCLQRLGCCQMH